MITRLVALTAAVGVVVGGTVAVAMHFMSWTISAPLARGYSSYRHFSSSGPGPYASTLTVQWAGPGAAHLSWWPLLPIDLGVGLGAGAIIGFALTLAGVQFRHAPRTDPR